MTSELTDERLATEREMVDWWAGKAKAVAR
jgi:hypothetical protein